MAKEMFLQAGRRRIRVSNPDKLLFPADGFTKLDLAEYYAAVEPAMRPHVDDRPLNVWRWNAGIDKGVVVQQEIPKGVPDWVRRVEVPRRGKGGTVTHAVGGAQVCVALAQFNCVTPHAWTARPTTSTSRTGSSSTSTRPTRTRARTSRSSAPARSRSATCCASSGSSRSR